MKKVVATEKKTKCSILSVYKMYYFPFARIMWNNFRLLSVPFLRCPEYFTQSKRTAFVLKRKLNVKLNKLGSGFPKKLKRREFYYELVEDTDTKKKSPVEVVLTENVPGIGVKGERLEMNMYIAYRDLLLPKLCVYASSSEARAITMTKEEKQYSSKYNKIVENFLASQAVQIILSNDTPWTLEPWHVKLALRKNGILTNEDCITIPKKISGPKLDIENKDFLIYLTMNKSETFPLRCRIHFWSTLDTVLNQKSFDLHSLSEPLFPDEKETIDVLIKTAEDIKKNETIRRRPQTEKSKRKK